MKTKRKTNARDNASRKSKKQKNPTNNEWIRVLENSRDDTVLFVQAIKDGDVTALSRAMVYSSNPNEEMCKDCPFSKWDCVCEGSRKFKLDSTGNRIYEPCEECKLNYCLCDFGLNLYSSPLDVRKVAIKYAKEKLNNKELKNLSILLK